MNICSFDHDEIVFECRKCPLCEAKKEAKAEIDDLQAKLDDTQLAREQEAEEANTALTDLKGQVRDLELLLLHLKGEIA